jgi:hypothetical protein
MLRFMLDTGSCIYVIKNRPTGLPNGHSFGCVMSPNPISLALVVILAGLGALAILAGYVVLGAVLIAAAVIAFTALKMAQQWERAVILRAGKFLAVRGPGLFGIVSILDNIAALIDTRLRTTQFIAERP